MAEFKNLHILIAEDDIDDGQIILESFTKHLAFAQVDLVQNGKELLDFLKQAAIKPNIILTDINMPILDGIEALGEISNNIELREIPAFVYSTTINPIYEARCMELGIKGFLVKPYTLRDFDDIPNKIINILDAEPT